MKIRSITLFSDSFDATRSAKPLKILRLAFEKAGFEVHTLRQATQPFPLRVDSPSDAVAFAQEAEAHAKANELRFVSIGTATGEWIDVIPDMLAATELVFCAITIASRDRGIDVNAIRRAAKIMRRVAQQDAAGNLRLAALANISAGAPFFPAAYHDGGEDSFALAIEAADLAVSACANAKDAIEAREALSASIEMHATQMATIAERVGRELNLHFGGIDFSLAPFPTPECSIGAAIERLSGSPVGEAGSIAAAALLADAIGRARFPRCGYSGLMLAVIEDTVLAQRVIDGTLTLNSLLLMSTVCGSGLDTVPLPGDVSEEALSLILFDLAAQALRLNKPLSARLLPIPGKRAGDVIRFDWEFFTDCGVLAIDSMSGLGLLQQMDALDMRAHLIAGDGV